jgi:hypothetical protein
MAQVAETTARFLEKELRATACLLLPDADDKLQVTRHLVNKRRELRDVVAKEREEEGAKFARCFGPLLNALHGLGGSAKADEAMDRVAGDLRLSDDVLNEVLPGHVFEIRSRGH